MDSSNTVRPRPAPAELAAQWWRNPYPWIVLALLVLAVLLTVPAPLANDIRYEAGTHFTSVYPVSQTFSHRPLMHRFITEGLFRPAWLATGGDRVAFEMVVRVQAIVVSGLAAAALWFGLRSRARRLASPVSAAALGGLLLCSTGIAWEPDWLAIVLTLAGTGIALLRRPVGPILGGVLLATASVIKFVSLPIALIGLLALLVLDERGPWQRRRFVVATISATVAGITWLVALAVVWPWEIQWLLDGSQMQPRRPLYDHVSLTFELLGNALIMWPAFALIPACLVRATRGEKVLVIGSLVLAWLPVVAQQQYFPYHLASFPVVASIALVMGLRRGGSWLAQYALGGAVGALVVFTLDPPTRVSLLWPLVGLWVAYAVVGVMVQRRRIHAFPDRATRRLSALATLVGVICLVPISLPWAPWSVTVEPSRQFSTNFSLSENIGLFGAGERIREEIGPETPVLYLAFGDQVFAVGNPTFCQFPTNVFVQRGEWEPPVLTTETYAHNRACLDDPRNEYLVWDKSYLNPDRQPPEVIAQIERNFDCENAQVHNVLTLCPRR
ncbi:hypothetical protein ACQBAU_00830 [Propionibacteriaceae bacterium Y2011]